MSGPPYHGRTHGFVLNADNKIVGVGTDPIAFPDLVFDDGGSGFVDQVTTHTDLLGYWRMGAASGSQLDSSGNGHTATYTLFTTAGTYDVAGSLPVADDDGAYEVLSVDGTTGDGFNGPDADPWPFRFLNLATFTVECFFRPKTGWTYAGGTGDSAAGIAGTSHGTGSGTARSGWGLVIGSDMIVGFFRGGEFGARDYLYAPYPLVVGTSYHLAGTFDGTTARLYIDGELVAALSTSTNVGTTNYMKLGYGTSSLSSSQVNRFPRGALDEVAVYTSALSDSTIADHAAGAGIAVTGTRIVSVTGAYTASASDDVILANGTFTVTLPTTAANSGARITIKNTGTGTITVAQNGSETTDGSTTDTSMATTKMAREFTCDGTGWQITAAYL